MAVKINKILNYTIAGAAVVGGSVLLVNLMLTQEAKRNIAKTFRKISDLGLSAMEQVMDPSSCEDDTEKLRENREWIDEQWKRAGY